MPPKREFAVHAAHVAGGTTCQVRTYRHLARVFEDVTCRRCVFLLVRSGHIPTGDPRVTDAMRAHDRFPRVPPSEPCGGLTMHNWTWRGEGHSWREYRCLRCGMLHTIT